MKEGKGNAEKPLSSLLSFLIIVLICEIIWRFCQRSSDETLTDKGMKKSIDDVDTAESLAKKIS